MMHPQRKQRLLLILSILIGLCVAGGLALYGLRQNINLFYTPSDVYAHTLPTGTFFRLGGMVKKGSVVRSQHGTAVQFVLTDLKHDVSVSFDGILPDLFREGQGIVTEGRLDPKSRFIATEVLAKHDARYVPKDMPYRSHTPASAGEEKHA